MNVLITGGAGYIGSVVTEDLVGRGHRVIAVDNLVRGNRAAVVPEAVFYQADIGDQSALGNIFQSHRVDAVLHLAANTSVEESVAEPTRFFWNNVACGINLLETMLKHQVDKLVFSSTAAVYGQPDKLPVTESAPTKPINAYGESKLMFERLLGRYGDNFGMSSVSLRFFNVAGASRRFGADHHPDSNLIPRIVKAALGQQDRLPVFGTDYETIDGTGIRDYIHVLDIAQALTLSLDYLQKNSGVKVYNLGNDGGYSVFQVIEIARRVTGAEIPIQICPRRPGDPAKLIASSNVAKREIGWQPRYPELESIIESAWRWQKEHPRGYNNR